MLLIMRENEALNRRSYPRFNLEAWEQNQVLSVLALSVDRQSCFSYLKKKNTSHYYEAICLTAYDETTCSPKVRLRTDRIS